MKNQRTGSFTMYQRENYVAYVIRNLFVSKWRQNDYISKDVMIQEMILPLSFNLVIFDMIGSVKILEGES